MRRAIGPLIIALSAWCAAGTVTVASAESALNRLAAPAPWWVFVLSLALAALIPAWRARPGVASIALVSTLPWWPIPLPAAAMIWTGPLAWLPIICAGAAAIGIRPVAAAARLIRTSDYRWAMLLAGVLTIAASGAAAWAVAPRVPSGDEPHYLIIAESLLNDGDLQVENNYRDGKYREYSDRDLHPDFIVPGVNGQIYSIHAPGLAVLLAPAFALLGYRGAELLLILLAGATGSLLWHIAWRVTGDSGSAWFAWASIVGSATFLLHSFAVFPDGPASLVLALTVVLVIRLRTTPNQVGLRAIVFCALLLASLPWLHTRLAVLASGAGAAIVWALLADASRNTSARVIRIAAFLGVPAISAVGWLAFFQVIYGTPNPAAPYGPATASSAAYIPGGLLALFFDGQFGLIAYSPVFAAAAFGLARIAEPRIRTLTWVTTLAAIGYLSAVTAWWMWWSGLPSSPARYTTAILPVFAAPLALAWSRSDLLQRKFWLALLAVTIGISGLLLSFERGELAWNLRTAEPRWLDWLGTAANLPRAWPSFFQGLTDALSSELAFAAHTAIWLTTYVASWLVIRTLVRRQRTWDAHGNLVVAFWLLGSVMTAASLGWWFTGVTGLDPARSQLQVIGLARAGRPVFELAPLRVRPTTVDGAIRVRTEEPGRGDQPPPWFDVPDVAPGHYDLFISTSRPVGGGLSVALGTGVREVQVLTLEPISRQTLELDLPDGAIELTLVADAALQSVGHLIELVPTRRGR